MLTNTHAVQVKCRKQKRTQLFFYLDLLHLLCTALRTAGGQFPEDWPCKCGTLIPR